MQVGVVKYVNSVSKPGMTTGMHTGRHTDRHVWTPYKGLRFTDACDADTNYVDVGGECLSLATTTDTPWSRTGGRMSTSPGRSRSATVRGGSRAVAPSRRRAGDKSSSTSTSLTVRSDYKLHLVVTASVGGCLLVVNVTLFFCLYCHRRVRHRSPCVSFVL